MLTRLLEDKAYRDENRDQIIGLFENDLLMSILTNMLNDIVTELSSTKLDSYEVDRKNCLIARLQVVIQLRNNLKQLRNAVDIETQEIKA